MNVNINSNMRRDLNHNRIVMLSFLCIFFLLFIVTINGSANNTYDRCEALIVSNKHDELSLMLSDDKETILNEGKGRSYNLLHYAAGLPSVSRDMIETLIDFGFDINENSELGKKFNSLEIALSLCGYKNINIITYMIRLGAMISNDNLLINNIYIREKYNHALKIIDNEDKVSPARVISDVSASGNQPQVVLCAENCSSDDDNDNEIDSGSDADDYSFYGWFNYFLGFLSA